MKKSDNVINIQLSDNQGKLHIRIAAGIFLRILMIIHLNYLLMGEK